MKIERLPEYFTTVVAVIIGTAIAYWFGILAGEGSVGTVIGWLAFGGFIALLLSLRQYVWMLIPITASLAGQLPQVQYGPALHDVVVVGVAVAYFTLIAFKVIKEKPKFETIDFWVFVNVFYIVITWLRHPTGSLAMGSDRIGGRAYGYTALAFISYWILARSALPSLNAAKWMLRWIIGVIWFQGILNILANFSPNFGLQINQYYSGVTPPDPGDPDAPPAGPNDVPIERNGYVSTLAQPVASWLLARFNPFTLINPLYAWRCLCFLICAYCSLLAGFRSEAVNLAGFFLVATMVRSHWLDVVRVGFLGFLGILGVWVLSQFGHAPGSVQRALCFLPGNWDPGVVADARVSSEWRYEMWRLMLTEPRYIENKWLGDGFGFSMTQFSAITQAKTTADQQENFMIIGQVHSGPISAIRFVGVVGLLLYLIFAFYMAYMAFRIARACLGTELSTLVLFLCMQMIWQPVNFIAVFGSYDGNLPQQIYWAGLLKMVGNTLQALGIPLDRPKEVRTETRALPRPRMPRRPQSVPAYR
jgi:hypothetical protein